jgi:hypothetical protein
MTMTNYIKQNTTLPKAKPSLAKSKPSLTESQTCLKAKLEEAKIPFALHFIRAIIALLTAKKISLHEITALMPDIYPRPEQEDEGSARR